jgi:hypothetical protein
VDSSRLAGWVAGKTGACSSRFPVLASFLGSNTSANKQEGIRKKHTHRSSGLGPLNRCLLKGVFEAIPDTLYLNCLFEFIVQYISSTNSFLDVVLN